MKKLPVTETLVMLATVVAVLATHNLAIGVLLGVALSAVFFARSVGKLLTVHATRSLDGRRVYQVQGALFFVTVDDLLAAIDFIEDEPQVQLDLTGAHIWDESAVAAIDRADRPFQVDDVVTVDGHTGVIDEVGLRTCRIRTFEGTLVTVPNKVLVGGAIENLSARTARRFLGTIGLVYETSSDDLDAAMAAIREILEQHPKVRDDFAVRFANFGDSALELSVLYWVVPPGDYFDVVGEINRSIKRRFDEGGWDMAFPSMTIYRAA